MVPTAIANKSKSIHYLSAILCFAITIGISGLYLKGLMFDPNQHAPTFGGDGLTIHYNLQYHATYGTGTSLSSQYYPSTEAIFMTDAQGLLACVLAKLRNYFPGLPVYSVGISNFLIYWSNGLAAVMIFLCLVRLKIANNKLAVALAVLIALLSPQIHRQTCGHYALGYAFILPSVFYFLLHRKFSAGYIIKSILLAILLILLGLNNPYLLAISCSLLLACFGIGLIANFLGARTPYKILFLWLAVSIISLLVTQGILHSLDEVTDRVKVPFGFFENVASFKGLFYPDETWIAKPLSKLFSSGPNSFESRSYIGIIPLLILFSLPFTWFKRKKFFKSLFNDNNLGIIFLGSIAVLIFAFGEPFNQIKEWSLAHLGQVLQFRAPGRFSWVFYFGIALVASVHISKLLPHLLKRKYGGLILALVLLLWATDVHQFLSWRTENRIHHNAFSPDQLAPIYKVAADLRLDSSSYHGIYLLPTEHGWTDKVYHHGSWRSNYDGYRYSLATGLPLINGKLSRASLSNTLSSMQLVSNPLIKRPLLDKFSKDKSILILRAAEAELSPDENSFMAFSDTIYTSKDLILGRVDLAQMESTSSKDRLAAKASLNGLSQAILYEHYEENSSYAYAGTGSRLLIPGKQTVIKHPISIEDSQDTINMSLWYYADNSISGGPWWTAQVKSDTKVTTELREWSLNITDTQKGWLRVEFLLPVSESDTEIVLTSEYRNKAYIDELLIKSAKDTITFQDGDLFYYNNYLIE